MADMEFRAAVLSLIEVNKWAIEHLEGSNDPGMVVFAMGVYPGVKDTLEMIARRHPDFRCEIEKSLR